jgi:hypothetical protein
MITFGSAPERTGGGRLKSWMHPNAVIFVMRESSHELPSRTVPGGSTSPAAVTSIGGNAVGTVHADAALVNAIITSHVTVKHLWVRYRSLGGARTRQELQDYLTGVSQWSEGENALLTFALRASPAGTA